MKFFNLHIRGIREVIKISEGQKQIIEKALDDDDQSTITVGGNLIKLADIKSILEVQQDHLKEESDRSLQKTEREWYDSCLQLSRESIESKVNREIKTRIEPAYRLLKMHIEISVLSEIRKIITAFFTANPRYPRCPVSFYFPSIANDVKIQAPLFGKWWEYVIRNDTAIIQWCNAQHIRIQKDFQIQPE